MIYFSYNDYSDYMENGEIEKLTKVEEETVTYEVKSGENKVSEDKDVLLEKLKNKNHIKQFLIEFLNFKEINYIQQIKYCKNASILNNEEKDSIIYKIEDKQIFIHIKVIEDIEQNISYKMLECSLKIIEQWKKENKNKRYPIVIPILIYIGKETWKNCCKTIKDTKYITFENNRINFSYNIINLKDLSIETLKNMNSEIAKELLIIKKQN